MYIYKLFVKNADYLASNEFIFRSYYIYSKTLIKLTVKRWKLAKIS